MALLQEIQVPLLAVNDTILTVVELGFSSGQQVRKGDLVMVFETSKTTYDVEAAADGFIQYDCAVDQDYSVNTVVARIFSDAAEAVALSPGSAAPAAAVASSSNEPRAAAEIMPSAGQIPSVNGKAHAGTAFVARTGPWQGETLFTAGALKTMSESGIDRSAFAGRDLVNKADVLALLQPAVTTKVASGETLAAAGFLQERSGVGASPRTAQPAVDPAKAVVGKLSSAKKREIEYLSDVQSTGLTSTIYTYVETEGIFLHINRSLKYLKDSLLPVIIYETSRLLADYPMLNGYFAGSGLAVYKEINLGFAVDIEKGLKVLKIPATDSLGITAIEQAILDLSGKYLEDELEVGDLTDITFTVTDLSAEGVSFFHPLVNRGNSAILGVSAIDEKLGRSHLALTFDHRVTEGKVAARFLKELKERLESYRAQGQAAYAAAITCFKCYKTLAEDLAGTGFARCITPEGKEGYICQSCLKGF